MMKVGVVLVIGDVDGNFTLLFQKMTKLLSKLKNISMALCVGNFFGPNCDDEWDKVLSGTLQAPIQMYILGPTSPELTRFYPDVYQMNDLAERITYLGKSGTYRTAEDVKIAYFSGNFSKSATTPVAYSYDDINKVTRDATLERPDFLMTWSWPHDFGTLSDINAESSNKDVASTFLLSFLAPQYHAAASERKLVEVPIERFYDDGRTAGITRFLGLSSLDCKSKTGVNWMKALNVNPLPKESDPLESKNKLLRIVSLPLPGIAEFSKRIYSDKSASTNIADDFNRWSLGNSRKNNRKRHPNDRKLHLKKELPCWFCLGTAEVEKHLIIAVGDFTFLALAKGPLVSDHVLISSIYHDSCMRVTGKETRDEVEKFKDALRDMFGTSYHPVFYERAFRSSHLQIQCVPVPTSKVARIVPAFTELAEKYEFAVNEFKDGEMNYEIVNDTDYFHVDLSHGHELLIAGQLEPKFPINFGREALAMEEVLNIPEKKDWKQCKQTEQEEILFVNKFKQRFRKFDFT